MTKFVKSVSFNDKNEDDKKILKHVSRRNFSGYAKKLMLADIARKEAVQEEKEPEAPKPLPTKKPLTASEKMSRMREKINRPTYSQPTLYHNQPKQR